MEHITIPLVDRTVDGYAIPVGPVSLIFVTTEHGMIGCGAFDIGALGRLGVPAAKMQSMVAPSITTIREILDAEVKEVNPLAIEVGIRIGMTGEEALEHL